VVARSHPRSRRRKGREGRETMESKSDVARPALDVQTDARDSLFYRRVWGVARSHEPRRLGRGEGRRAGGRRARLERSGRALRDRRSGGFRA